MKFNFLEHDTHYEVFPNKVLLTLDWVQLTLEYVWETSPFVNSPNDFKTTRTIFNEETSVSEVSTLTFIRLKGRTKHFNRLYTIEHDNVKIADLECEHNGGVTFDQNKCRIKLNNFILYTNKVRRSIYLIFSHLNIISYKLSRLDIAGDNFMEMRQILKNTLYAQYTFENAYHAGNGRKFHGISFDSELGEFESYRIGSEKTGLVFSFYHKGQELKQSNKAYIQSFLEDNGVDLNNAYRFEIRLTKDELKKYFINETIVDKQKVERILVSEYTGEIQEINNHILSPTFMIYCKYLYYNIMNERLKFRWCENNKPIFFRYHENIKIQQINWDKEPNYRFEKQLYTYYIYQYLDNYIVNVYDWEHFANKVFHYSPYNWYYLERQFIDIVPRFWFKQKNLKLMSYEHKNVIAVAKQVIESNFKDPYIKAFEDITLANKTIHDKTLLRRQKILKIHDFLLEMLENYNKNTEAPNLHPKLLNEKKYAKYFTRIK